MSKFTPISVPKLGEYLREQRHSAQLSLRQLSEVAGVSNPYLSQIERGLKKPSAEILQALAKALRISAESLYIRAGILEERTDLGGAPLGVTEAILADPRLTDRQRGVLLDVYDSFVGELEATEAPKALKALAPEALAPKASAPKASAPKTSQPGSIPAKERKQPAQHEARQDPAQHEPARTVTTTKTPRSHPKENKS